MYYRLAIIFLTVILLTGCVQISPRYLKGSEYDKAVLLYQNGMFLEAKAKAEAIPPTDAGYKNAKKLIAEINSMSLQIARRHMELGDDYERAGIYQKAVAEYSTSLKYNPSNTLLNSKISALNNAMKEGVKIETEKPKAKDPEYNANLHYMKGKMYLDSKAYGKAVDQFNAVLKYTPSYMNTKELLARARKERDKAVDRHLKNGIAYFQAEEMELAIKEWDSVLELDPGHKTAADYKSRAEVILERLKRIREKQAAE
ncbi:MAG: hypothetical protein HYS21_10465 [Deltaproteobacteria bacterium]|nr:hypothetical protein [Deltaproteobacteria bacterium]